MLKLNINFHSDCTYCWCHGLREGLGEYVRTQCICIPIYIGTIGPSIGHYHYQMPNTL